jgi:hypothetical protein
VKRVAGLVSTALALSPLPRICVAQALPPNVPRVSFAAVAAPALVAPWQAVRLEARQAQVQSTARRSHWLEGALIGGLVGAAFGQVMLSLADDDRYSSGERITFTVLTAFPGAVAGALVGAAFPKHGEAN